MLFFSSLMIVCLFFFVLRYVTLLFSLNRTDDHKGWRRKMFTLENRWGERSKCGATRFRQLFAQAMARWTIFLFFLFFHLCSLSFSLHIWWAKAQILNIRRDDAKCVKEERKERTNKRTNEPASFCLYSSYSRRTIVYIYFFPQRSNQPSVNEQHCVFVHLFVQFVF